MSAERRSDPRMRKEAVSHSARAPDSLTLADEAPHYLSRMLLRELAAHAGRVLPWLAGVDGTMVVADVSGFTALSERLASGGREGAEQLTDVINTFFDGLLEIAERYGGDTLTFGGDAVLLLFSGSDHALRAVTAARAMLDSLERLAPRRVGRHRIELGISLGAHSAEFVFVAAGTEDRAHVLAAGPDSERAALAESAADTGTLVVTDRTRTLLGERASVEPVEPGLWRVRSLLDDGPTVVPAAERHTDVPVDTASLLPYLPPLLAEAVRSGVRPPALEGEHRKVTVVFANVSGVDELLGEPDPSALLTELQAYLASVFELLEQHGGTLISSDVGVDGAKLVIAFGAPIAREHDAESAARFALEMRDLISERGLCLQHRLGVHRASVYAGNVGSAGRRQYTVMGDGVNLTARLMAHARPGTVVASRELVSMLDGRFRCDSLGTIRVKGRDEPVDVCELAEETRSEDVLAAGAGDLPLVGREQELALIAETVDHVQHDGGRVLLVAGEPGIGKSRLVAEAVDRARALGWRTLQAACYAHTSTTPYAPWLPLLEQLLELDGEAGDAERKRAVLDRVDSLVPEMSEQAPLLGPLLGLALPHTPLTRALDQTSRRRSLLRLVATLFERAAALGPVAIAIEDLQWADESSLDMLEAVASASSSAPLLLLVSARPAGIERLRLPPERTTRIELSPLKQDAAAQLLEAAAGVTRVPKALSELLYARTAGNPLFLEEMARTLGQSDVFDRLEGASSIAAVETISQLDFPDRVQTLLMARIDRLDAPARSTLRHAAVIGQVFDVDALAALERPAGAAAGDVPAEVSRLERLGLFVPAAGDGGRYRFRHALLQEVAYGSLRFDRRRTLHHQLAHYLEQHLGATEDARLDEVTHHYRRSGDRPKTFRYAVRSAVRARDIYATREAIDYYRIAFDSEPSRSADGAGVRSVLLEQLGDGYQLMGCHRDAIGTYRDALRRWKRVEDRSPSLAALDGLLPEIAPGEELHATLCHKIAACYERESRRYDRADHWIAEALAHLPGSPSSLPARVYSTQGIVRMRQGRYNASIRSCERAAAHARRVDDDFELAWALNTLSFSYAALGHLETAITVQQRSVTLLRKVGDLRRLSAAYGNLANCYMRMGDMEQALSHNREALAIETRIGAADGAAATSANIGEIEVLLGRFEAAIEHLDSALETSKDAGSDGMSGFVLTNLSRAHAGSGDLASARTSIDEAVELLTRAGMPGTLAEASIQQADVTRLEGRPADALPLCARALQDLARIGERTTRIVGLRVKGEALAALGRRAEAARALNESISLAREIGASLELTRSVAAREGLEAEGRNGTA